MPMTVSDAVMTNPSTDEAMQLIENCLIDIDNWMTLNKLKLNRIPPPFLQA
jgi:hypothetical protein